MVAGVTSENQYAVNMIGHHNESISNLTKTVFHLVNAGGDEIGPWLGVVEALSPKPLPARVGWLVGHGGSRYFWGLNVLVESYPMSSELGAETSSATLRFAASGWPVLDRAEGLADFAQVVGGVDGDGDGSVRGVFFPGVDALQDFGGGIR